MVKGTNFTNHMINFQYPKASTSSTQSESQPIEDIQILEEKVVKESLPISTEMEKKTSVQNETVNSYLPGPAPATQFKSPQMEDIKIIEENIHSARETETFILETADEILSAGKFGDFGSFLEEIKDDSM